MFVEMPSAERHKLLLKIAEQIDPEEVTFVYTKLLIYFAYFMG